MGESVDLTTREKELIRHAVGFDGRSKTSYRNHFVVGPGMEDYDVWMGLVKRGLAYHAEPSPLSGGDDIFWVSRAAALAVRQSDEHLSPEFRDGGTHGR